MTGWIDALKRTRQGVAKSMANLFAPGRKTGEQDFEELEETLLRGDVPPRLVVALTDELRERHDGASGSGRDALRDTLLQSFDLSQPFSWFRDRKPFTVLMVGINGSGKTTTCAKLAYAVKRAGLDPVLAATDTFRAAGADQLRMWSDRLGVEVVAGEAGADAAAVAYDALDAACARRRDVLIIDTAGRMHTKKPLMNELQKIERTLSKRLSNTPDETWITLDASLGQNAIQQAKVFNESVPLTGVIITKLDGSSKGGFVFSISKELGLPIRFVGLGESADDLVPFQAEKFVNALLGVDEKKTV